MAPIQAGSRHNVGGGYAPSGGGSAMGGGPGRDGGGAGGGAGRAGGAGHPAPPDDITDPATPITLTYSSLVAIPQGGAAARYTEVRVTLTQAGSNPSPEVTGLTVSFINANAAPFTPTPAFPN